MSLAHQMDRMEAAYLRAFRTDDWCERGNKCAYCHDRIKRSDVTGDHLIPRARGGTTNRKNIRSACQPCNKLKGHLSASAFKKLLAHPPPGSPLPLLLAHVRRRLNLRTERAVKRIRQFVGL